MYVILDIETTGGKYNEEGITEIAAYKFDGLEVVDQFISLVNPEREIQPFVVNLTGINNNMLKNAPKFFEVAKRIVEITEDCIIVAHNAQFDYRILRTEFKRLGFEFKRKTLCTVELSKQLIPDQPSYSLGKLTRALGIPITDRHRASGDALATVKLFKILLNKDVDRTIVTENIKMEPKFQMAPSLKNITETLPMETGVYYIHDSFGKLIYIGKSKNIRSRINQHFTGTDSKSRKLQKQVAAVSFDLTGTELIALLKENHDIKHHKPIHNRALRRSIFTDALYSFKDSDGYIQLKIEKADGRKKPITTFTSRESGLRFLHQAVETYALCQKLTGLYPTKSACFKRSTKECKGACIKEETTESYNERVKDFIAKTSLGDSNFLILDRGRTIEERSVIHVENGVFKGLGFYNLNYQITNPDVLQSIITPMENNRDAQHIIQSFIRRNKSFKIVHL